MAVKGQKSNTIALLAILVGFLCLGGMMLFSPSAFHLTCQKIQCRYTESAVIGGKTVQKFPIKAVSEVSIHETHSRSGTTYHVYLKEAGKQLEVSKFGHHRDADALVERINRFMKAPTDAPMDIDFNNKSGMLMAMSIAGFALLLGLLFSGMPGKKISPVKIRIKTNIRINQSNQQR